MTSATVWLLHPNKLFREGMKRILSESPFLVIAEAAGVQNAGCLADAPVPDLVLLGEKVFPTSLAALLISGPVDNVVEMPGGRRGLSERENQILRSLLKGESNKMIANRLGITEATVKVHLKTVLRKIGAANRTQAAIWALNNGYDQNAPILVAGA